jgi:acetyltransferase-like isoleucine patch superfamily enzyme
MDFKSFWTRFWMHFAGLSLCGRISTRLASWFAPPYYGRVYLADLNRNGYVSPSATIHHRNILFGSNVFVGDRVVIFEHYDGGSVELGDRAQLHADTYIQTGQNGAVKIGRDTHVHPRCQFSAYKGSIEIGNDIQIAPGCAFYPYDHGLSAGESIARQPLITKGDITVGDGAWLGYGVIVLSGVRIGKGAVVGSGSIVVDSIPDGAIAVGSPARVVRMRT